MMKIAQRIFNNATATREHCLNVAALLFFASLATACSEPVDEAMTALNSPAGPGSATPHLSRAQDGTVVLSWLEPEGDGDALRYSVLAADNEWGPAKTVAQGKDWFINWADFPSVTPISTDLWAAHWLAKSPGGTYAYDVALAISRDGGLTWDAPINPHTDGTRTEHGFVSLFPWNDGVGALWLDGRNTRAEGHSEHGSSSAGGMTLRSAVIEPEQAITDGRLVDELVCDCCQTDIAITDDGPIAVYRNRTSEEIRDIYVARNVNGDWQPETVVANDGWKISGCPVNGPAIVANGMHTAVAWFTAANGVPRVQVAHSMDGGASFATPVDVDVERPIGRVDVEMLDNGVAIVSWLRSGQSQHGDILARTVAVDGELGPVQVIATTNAARSSGFPQMTLRGDELIFAWTDTSADHSLVQSRRVAVTSLNELN